MSRVAGAGLVAVLLVLPWTGAGEYPLALLYSTFMYSTLAVAWNVIGGLAGYLSFGHAAFFGLGGYTTGLLLVHAGLSPFLTAPLGGLAAAVFAALAGYPCLRLRGPYFAVVTMILGLAVRAVILNLPWTGAAEGLWMPLPPWEPLAARRAFYYAMLAVALVTVLAARAVQLGKIGVGLEAIREDEEAAQSIGVPAVRLKIGALILSAGLTGLAGAVYAYDRSYVHPDFMFDLHLSVLAVLMALLGGRQSWGGPVLGAVVVRVVDEVLTVQVGTEAARVIFGLGLALVIVLLPEGLLPHLTRPRHRAARPRAVPATAKW
ncbi:MAG: branched-chain amino acid ABC transporter permease [Armatimonadota bacterium]|nr:branched-chain amino acid ABC transporter permease [Armatimonadota bacterium]MDR7441311.1 branched-chain amino acid ABC transporter permease [Armatimonadota bacterium]